MSEAHANMSARESSLVGKWFLSYHQGGEQIEWQGRVVYNLGGGYYLVQLYDWAAGAPAAQHVVGIAQMAQLRWAFFDDDAALRAAYEIAVAGSRRAIPHAP